MEQQKINNSVVKAKSMMQIQRDYVSAIGKGLSELVGNIDPYQAICGYNILNQINILLQKEGLNFKSPEVDRESVNNAVRYAILYRLNTDNKEIFVHFRNDKRDNKWIKVVEYAPQYKGTLKIVAAYGRDVDTVFPEWIVREGDDFTYQMMKGIEVIPPTWTPKGYDGKVVRVIVPIRLKNGFIDYRIAERESVATNLKAQISQSLMKDPKKNQIMLKIQNMTLDELLNDDELKDVINSTYSGLSREEMIITKLISNAVKRVPIDLKIALQRELMEKTYDNSAVYTPTHTATQMLEQQGVVDFPEIETTEEAKLIETKSEVKVDNNGVVVEQESTPAKEEKEKDIFDLFEEEDSK